MSLGKLKTFGECAAILGGSPVEKWQIFWRMTKNVRARVGVAAYHPQEIYQLPTRFGRLHLRDNFGDVTNLPDQLCYNVYRIEKIDAPGAILDIGANIGLFSYWIHMHNPDREIHCFEPLADNVRMISLNCPAAVINQVGLGKERKQETMRVDKHQIMASTVDTTWETIETQFEVWPLDSYAKEHGIEEVAFIKMDTEGMELDIIAGGQETFGKARRVAMETHGTERHQKSIGALQALDFTIEDEFSDGHTGMIYARR